MNNFQPGNTPEKGFVRSKPFQSGLPSINLPKGGGAVKGIEEKFHINTVTGTSAIDIPLPLSPSRHGFIPSASLSYNSGNGNSPFGMGWELNIPKIGRRTEKRLPQYRDDEETDTFILSGAEDLIPLLEFGGNQWIPYAKPVTDGGESYTVKRYRPRIEGLFAVIEHWENNKTGETHWRTITSDNTHSYYGLTGDSRITDPDDASRVFEWKLCRTHDDKGNIVIYSYKKEDYKNAENKLNEQNRKEHTTQSYIKEIWYGNKTPYYLGDAIPERDRFMFLVIFDYGEHEANDVIPKDIYIAKNDWPTRKDPFSSFRSGFEIRTYRRCNRVFLFHCFDNPELPHNPYLTKSLQLFYDDDLALTGNGTNVPGYSFLVRARQNGHRWDETAGAYTTKSLPELELTYQQHEWVTEIKKVDGESSRQAPVGLDDKTYMWVDLYSEGIAGILTEQSHGWFYKSNLGDGGFTQAALVPLRPNLDGMNQRSVSVLELQGDGTKYLVGTSENKGFYKLTKDDEWEPFKAFEQFPDIDLSNPNLRAIDLNGDGITDLLFSDESRMCWYPGAGEKGFELPVQVSREVDEEKGPALLFSDITQSIFLADMSGDGLTDIVRIRNGEICYWPNLGYGRFGSKINMDNAPVFDYADAFNPSFLRLADIDGSGTTDIIYLGRNDFRVWMNRNGNEWSIEPQVISAFPFTDPLADISLLDFLGTGTACIVYSSSHPSDTNHPLQYIDLMGSKKPHLLKSYANNCGNEVFFEYKSSTLYYLEDKNAGRKWITRLPFPVHCVSSVTSQDLIRGIGFTCSYRYSHGYFDPVEKEYRGFARVEQYDTQDFSLFRLNDLKNVVEEQLHQPPVHTVMWYHTGAWLGADRIFHQCRDEYFRNNEFTEYEFPDPLLPGDLSAGDLTEAVRAMKGVLLRREMYAGDNTPLSGNPYVASLSNVEVRMIQPRAGNKYGSFLILSSEAISYAYERNVADPRISHSFILECDDLGNATKSVSVVYPRVKRPVAPNDIPDKVWDEQSKLHIIYAESSFTNDIIDDAEFIYRRRTVFESRSFEISGITIAAGSFTNLKTLQDKIAQINADPSKEIPFEQDFDGSLQKRLSGHSRTYFLKNDLTTPLELGKMESLSLIHENFQLAFTEGLVTRYYGTRVTDAMLLEAKYVHLEGDQNWWIPSGTVIYPPDPKAAFYTPSGMKDAFGNESTAEYDEYSFLVKSTTDAAGNTITAVNDYRTLGTVTVVDPNLNRSMVETDELGFVIKSAVMGKEGSADGDTLSDPTTRIEYDLFNWKNNAKPNYVHSFMREKHGAANTRWQENYMYSDGNGSIVMSKAQVEPGIALQWNPAVKQVEKINANPRWVGNGRVVVNNKGNVVKSFEPYFSVTEEYEDEAALVETGITPVLYYDPIGRNIRTEYPNGTFTRMEFDSWHTTAYDVNDTVKDSQWYTDRGSPDPLVIPEPADPDQRAAWLAAKHYNTPLVTHTDSAGRMFYAVSDHGNAVTHVYSEKDLTGRYSRLFDQLDRTITESYINLEGTTIYGKSPEKGERWILPDVSGSLVRAWDNNLREYYSTYDSLHRPVAFYVKEGGTDYLFGLICYADTFFDKSFNQNNNLCGRTYRIYDQAGSITVKKVDFKGNSLEVERRIIKDYRARIVDWKSLESLTDILALDAAAAPLLEPELFTGSTELDALNRAGKVTVFGGTVYLPTYNEANNLKTLQVQPSGQGSFVTFLEKQSYDAKGQRQYANYGNGSVTSYNYDPKTYLLTNLVTKLKDTDTDSQAIQNIRYTFDAIGNITQIRDDAQQTYFFQNNVVYPENKYEYDAIYQLIKATGREHAGLGGDAQRNNQDLPFIPQLPHPNDVNAVRNYEEQYEYDILGNIKKLRHMALNANWTQRYKYEYEDDASNSTNRLKAINAEGDPEGVFSMSFTHDIHGNMTSMPHLSLPDSLVWNCMDQLKEVNLGGGGKAYYVTGIGGNRMRKVIERPGGKTEDRIYLGAVEFYRERQGSNPADLERYTFHVADNAGRIGQIDCKTKDTNNSDPANPLNTPTYRYQYTNHLGSASLETDETGTILSYEEYHPFGSSSYRVAKPGTDLSLKRYRFAGKERDNETGFYYFGMRYYATWLGRWTSSDSSGFVDGINLFRYCRNNPVIRFDPSGSDSYDVRIQDDRFTGWENPSIQTFKDLVTQQGGKWDPRISPSNTQIYYIPNTTIELEERRVRETKGGTWVLHSDLPDKPPSPPPKKKANVTVTPKVVPPPPAPPPPVAPPVVANVTPDLSSGTTGGTVPTAKGQTGNVRSMGSQPKATYSGSGAGKVRTSENEHVAPGAQLKDITKNPDTGISDYNKNAYRRDATVRGDRRWALDKTNDPATGDNARTNALRQRGGPVNLNEDIVIPSLQNAYRSANATGSNVTNEAINRGMLNQLGNLFSTYGLDEVGGALPQQTKGQRMLETINNAVNRITYTMGGQNRFKAAGGELARNFVPGFVEAEMTAVCAPGIMAQVGITNATAVGLADAAAAAPTTFAAAVTLPLYGGAIVGNAVEDEVGVGGAIVAAAVTGAIIGSFIPIPGLGTLAGAVVGGALGVIGYGLSKLF